MTRHYAYLGTGNFNETTARRYADHGLLTCRETITREVGEVFEYLMTRKHKVLFEHLLVSGFDMPEKLLQKIDREIANARQGKPSGITIKVNNLEEKTLINKLYEASGAGVPVTLLVRSICCLVPGVKGWSERIRVIRLVDRYLEHARVYLFENEHQPEIYLSSADWMARNMHRRIEVAFPLNDEQARAEILKMLQLQVQDNMQAVYLDAEGNNCPVEKGLDALPVRAQAAFHEWLRKGLQSGTFLDSPVGAGRARPEDVRGLGPLSYVPDNQ